MNMECVLTPTPLVYVYTHVHTHTYTHTHTHCRRHVSVTDLSRPMQEPHSVLLQSEWPHLGGLPCSVLFQVRHIFTCLKPLAPSAVTMTTVFPLLQHVNLFELQTCLSITWAAHCTRIQTAHYHHGNDGCVCYQGSWNGVHWSHMQGVPWGKLVPHDSHLMGHMMVTWHWWITWCHMKLPLDGHMIDTWHW